MSLNIKSLEAVTLVHRLSSLTGENKTQAVLVAVRERLDRVRRAQDQADLAADLMGIGKRCAEHRPADQLDHGEFLYDDEGLPR